MIAVKEFIAVLEQGYAEAFLCRGNDENLYVVKSRLSGKESLIREWICGCIARELGLPIPPFELIYADKAVAEYSDIAQLSALAEAPGFASRFVATGGVALPLLNVRDVAHVDADVRRRILLFDWWVLNFDRTDENPNLLWDASARGLHVIDHNLAFDRSPTESFWSEHIFRNERARLSDPRQRAPDIKTMEAIIRRLPQFWSDMPDEWTEVSPLTIVDVDSIMQRCHSDDFWVPQ